ncbi:hypothetical protein [Ramlibacter sp. PS4R-6]|uniref:hypothetical protein n=1 Tax=Ramlibacter sp. PS4R-6 TaxID=3133438 RepID=UPI0030A9C139
MDKTTKDPRRPVLIGGVCLLGASAALYVAALLLAAATHPGLREAAGAFRALSPWVLLAGVLLTVLYFVVNRLADAPTQRQPDSMLYEEGETTTMEEPPPRDR